MARAFIIVMDGFGIGGAPDADQYGDEGANTFYNIAQWCAEGNTNEDRPDAGPLNLPTLSSLGLGRAGDLASGQTAPGFENTGEPIGLFGSCIETSKGKDTPSGHWEMAGLPVTFDWSYFDKGENAIPKQLIEDFCEATGLVGTLGNKTASGTAIINELGDEHVRTGKPILYTSADSVLQIAAHEEHFGLERLYEISEVARKLVDPYRIGRVIVRPILGENGNYYRTGNRKDLATPPYEPTLLDKMKTVGREVISIGKIADIFANQGITRAINANGIENLMKETIDQIAIAPNGSLVFTNLVNFDQDYGHRRNVGGYANALEKFDPTLKRFMDGLKPDDLLIITADHGCDPRYKGYDHTREQVPFLCWSPTLMPNNIGVRNTLADIGQTVAKHLDIPPLKHGKAAF